MEITISKSRITKSITERIQGTIYTYRPFRVGTGFERESVRYLSDRFRKGDRELSTGIIVAEEHLRHSRPRELSGKPTMNNGGDILVCPIDCRCTTIQQDKHYRLSRGIYSTQQLLLPSHQVKIRARILLTNSLFTTSQDHDGDIRLSGHLYRLINHSLLSSVQSNLIQFTLREMLVYNAAPFRITNLCTQHTFPYSTQHGFYGSIGWTITTHMRCCGISIRPNDSDALQRFRQG